MHLTRVTFTVSSTRVVNVVAKRTGIVIYEDTPTAAGTGYVYATLREAVYALIDIHKKYMPGPHLESALVPYYRSVLGAMTIVE